ncbi:hypothetical protein CGC59_10335 [Capnocytophaga sputigena]|jgi:hypothetical protein|uniref:Type IV toxin-antitoxin system AbiEi family antitoxin domain-containing protein n=1 Tax=Capnocytophaga sputigena TaxID=1019 RepID=A0A250F4H9_CAPSP|nr:DUF6088 family protein [Capnocytophaga sputigena]ATA80052.1 hypothetical protein CGC59_10335 [Capnocytophaga sputigena]
MKETVSQKVRNRIVHGKFGEIFFVSSFPKYDVEYTTKLLSLFEKEGLITRIAKGVYAKVKKTRFGILYPSVYELVEQIAKRDKAKVIPTGETAANRLGFSTQIPMNTTFLTSGSPRKLILNGRTITLKHGAPKNFAYKNKLIAELVQALRSIGEYNITPENKDTITKIFTNIQNSDIVEHDLFLAPFWIQKLIKKNNLKNNE